MTNYTILKYIPQRQPFVMIDDLLEADGQATTTSFTITKANILVENGSLSAAGLVENMAQTAAAGTGYTSSQEGKATPVGFIGALKSLKIYADLPAVGDTIITTVTLRTQVMNALVADATVSLRGDKVASCELKIFIQE